MRCEAQHAQEQEAHDVPEAAMVADNFCADAISPESPGDQVEESAKMNTYPGYMDMDLVPGTSTSTHALSTADLNIVAVDSESITDAENGKINTFLLPSFGILHKGLAAVVGHTPNSLYNLCNINHPQFCNAHPTKVMCDALRNLCSLLIQVLQGDVFLPLQQITPKYQHIQ